MTIYSKATLIIIIGLLLTVGLFGQGAKKINIDPVAVPVNKLIDNYSILLFSYLPQPGSEGQTDYCIYEYNPVSKESRGVLKMPNNYKSLNIEYHTTFSSFRNRYFVLLTLNNNIFEYNSSGLMSPGYTIDFGKYNAPEELLSGKPVDARILMGRIQKG
ncbi:MAG TPA: hypothetical protein DEQ09_00620 [Bacteroidales bacterium]|nr:hypothetical protein [Bacteroidales bacterium]